MAIVNPGIEIANVLENAGLGLELESNLFVSIVRPHSQVVPRTSVFVLPRNGVISDRVYECSYELQYPRVQIRIRSDRYATGYELARRIYQALQSQDVADFLDCRSQESEPVFLELDDADLYHWALNFEIMRQEGSTI